MSSLYGSGQADNRIMAIATEFNVREASSTADLSSFTNSEAIQKYVEREFADTPILVDIARCESTFKQFDTNGNVIRGRVNKLDVGVMQINEKYHGDNAIKLGMNIYTLEGNVAYGKYLYSKYGAQPWISSSPCWAKTGEIAIR